MIRIKHRIEGVLAALIGWALVATLVFAAPAPASAQFLNDGGGLTAIDLPEVAMPPTCPPGTVRKRVGWIYKCVRDDDNDPTWYNYDHLRPCTQSENDFAMWAGIAGVPLMIIGSRGMGLAAKLVQSNLAWYMNWGPMTVTLRSTGFGAYALGSVGTFGSIALQLDCRFGR